MTAPTLRILSAGLGTQSSCLALMSLAGELDPLDAIIFADTQHEMPETYRYLEFVRGQAEAAGVPFHVVTAGDLKTELIGREGKGGQPNLPVRVRVVKDGKETLERINAYRCSYDFKRRVVTAQVKRLCGRPGAWKNATVEQWIGISVEESSRMKKTDECRCGHNRLRRLTKKERAAAGDGALVALIHTAAGGCTRCACERFDPWQVNRWPLIEQRMRRSDCVRWIAAHGFPEPPRSACYFCPNRGNAHWRDLRANHPDLWASAIEVDEFVRHGMNEMRGQGYLHQSGVPLAEADIRPRYEQLQDLGIEPLFIDEVDTDCEAGVCFT